MSLHAQLSPQARAALDRQRRTSKAAAVILSLLGTTLIALILGFILLPAIVKDQAEIRTIHPVHSIDPPLEEPKVVQNFSQPSRPSAMPIPLIHVDMASPFSIPVPDALPTEATVFGDGDGYDIGSGFDEGNGNNGFKPLGPGIRQRCSKQDRLALLERSGGTAEIDDRVIRALRFMRNTQAADGGWGSKNRPAMTGLALLAYLGHCETALSEEFGDSCLNAIIFLTDIGMQHDGRLVPDTHNRHWVYEHAIATYALAEAETIHRALAIDIPHLRETVQKAGQLIIDNQHASGGWDYGYDISGSRGGDLSIAGWHVQALKACKLSGIEFNGLKDCAKQALAYVEARQASDGGFGYTGTAPVGNAGYATLTGVGMLSLQMWGQGSKPAVRKGAKYALANMPFEWDGPNCDLYGHYYLALAMFQRGGVEWDKYQPRFRDPLLQNQREDGSWSRPGGGGKPAVAGAMYAEDNPTGIHYRTALATLMLEVYYRYLPTGK